MIRSSNGRIALKAATVFGASSSSQRATKRIPAAVISSTARPYPRAAAQATSCSRSSSVMPVAFPGGIARDATIVSI